MDIHLLENPKKSHRKKIKYPQDSQKLAEFIGVVFGDGGINNQWQLVISMNYVADFEYSLFCSELIHDLFQVDVSSRKRPNQNTLVLVCNSTNLVDFLVTKGAARGSKISMDLDIPSWIAGNSIYSRSFVRGLVDTDGCLYIHKHCVGGKQYQNIGFCFTNYSAKIINSVGRIFLNNGIIPHFSKNQQMIFLYSHRDVRKYLEIFGTSNPRILNKYNEWRDAGVV